MTRLQTHVDLVLAMREAMEVTDRGDRTFLKSVLYRFREDRSGVTMKVTHGMALTYGKARRRLKAPATGFLLMTRAAEPETHVCTSPGGIAIAGYYDEALRISDSSSALGTLIKAVSQTLASGK